MRPVKLENAGATHLPLTAREKENCEAPRVDLTLHAATQQGDGQTLNVEEQLLHPGQSRYCQSTGEMQPS